MIMMYCGIAERRGRVHGCACAVGSASAVQGACIGCAFVCCWPQGWGRRCWVQVRLLSLCLGGDGRMQCGGRFWAKPGEARGRVVLGRWCTCMHMGRRRAAAACSWLELGVAGRLRIPTQLGGDVHLVGCGGGLLLQQPDVEYRTPRALSSLICDLRTVGRLVDRCENT